METGEQTSGLLRLGPLPAGERSAWRIEAFVAVIALIVLLPAFVFIALLIIADTGRPIFFSQTRLGLHGRHFRLYKFRKFHAKESPNGRAVTLRGDSRLTRAGRLLERTKLDELPQLWNVLRGDMSFVGPRPESLPFADCFVEPYWAVLHHRPGIFGPSQALFRNEGALYPGDCDPEHFYRTVLFPAKARIDLDYYNSRGGFRDSAWVFCGVLALIGCSPLPQDPGMLDRTQKWYLILFGKALSPTRREALRDQGERRR